MVLTLLCQGFYGFYVLGLLLIDSILTVYKIRSLNSFKDQGVIAFV